MPQTMLALWGSYVRRSARVCARGLEIDDLPIFPVGLDGFRPGAARIANRDDPPGVSVCPRRCRLGAVSSNVYGIQKFQTGSRKWVRDAHSCFWELSPRSRVPRKVQTHPCLWALCENAF